MLAEILKDNGGILAEPFRFLTKSSSDPCRVLAAVLAGFGKQLRNMYSFGKSIMFSKEIAAFRFRMFLVFSNCFSNSSLTPTRTPQEPHKDPTRILRGLWPRSRQNPARTPHRAYNDPLMRMFGSLLQDLKQSTKFLVIFSCSFRFSFVENKRVYCKGRVSGLCGFNRAYNFQWLWLYQTHNLDRSLINLMNFPTI